MRLAVQSRKEDAVEAAETRATNDVVNQVYKLVVEPSGGDVFLNTSLHKLESCSVYSCFYKHLSFSLRLLLPLSFLSLF